MEANVLKRGFVSTLRGEVGTLWRHVRHIGGARSQTHGARSLLTAAEFQEELAILGLLGRRFVPKDYANALGDYLDISINIHVIPDTWHPELSRRWRSRDGLGNYAIRSN